MGVVRIFFTLTIFTLNSCYTRRVPRDVMLDNKVMTLINSYIKPLSESFPNHELEVQIDIQGPPLHHIGRGMSGRKVNINKPTMSRSGDASQWKYVSSHDNVGRVLQAATKPNQNPHSRAPIVTNPSPMASTPKTTPKKERTKEPVYKDELQKAMDDLEKKINKQLMKGAGGGDQNLRDQIVVSNSGPVTGGNNPGINRLIELIRRGVQFQKHVPNTEDGNMEWMQIKIPKILAEHKAIRKK